MNNTEYIDYYELAYNSVVKETEKAICLNVMVSWNANCRDKNIWFPKSVITFHTFTVEDGREITNAHVKNWFVHKLEKDNAFHGYEMHFETLLN